MKIFNKVLIENNLDLFNKFDLPYYIVKQNPFELEQFLANYFPCEIIDEIENTPFHLLCQTASDLDFFKEAWQLLIQKGFDCYKYNKALELPLHRLLFSNPNFYKTGALKEVIFFLYPQYYKIEHFPYPYNLHWFYFFQDYQHLYHKSEVFWQHPVALYRFQFKQTWFDEQIPSRYIYKELEQYFKAETLEELTFLLTGRSCKSFKKFVRDNWFKLGYKFTKVIRFVSQLNLENHQTLHILNFYIQQSESQLLRPGFLPIQDTASLYNWAIKQMSYHKFLKLFIKNPYFNEDTIRLMQQMTEHNLPLNLKKFKNTESLHNYCANQVNQILAQKKSIELKILEDDFKNIQNNIKIINHFKELDYEVCVPFSIQDLIFWGQQLKNCVGSINYIQQVVQKQIYIVFLKKSTAEYACCSINQQTLKIKEIRGFNNKPVDTQAQEIVTNAIKYLQLMNNIL